MLAVGSQDANRFHPGMGTVFLKLIAEAVARRSRVSRGKNERRRSPARSTGFSPIFASSAVIRRARSIITAARSARSSTTPNRASSRAGAICKPDQVQALLAGEHRRGLAPASLRALASAWRSFFRYLAREGEVAINPATGLRSPRVKRKLPEVLDADEMTALVEVPGDDRRSRARSRAVRAAVFERPSRLGTVRRALARSRRRRRLAARDRQGLEDAHRAGRREGARRARGAARHRTRADGRRSARARPRRQAADAERRARATQEARAGAGRVEARLSAPAAAFLREPSARIVGRSARRAGTARPRGHRARRRSTRISISSTWRRCTTRRIRARGGSASS